MLAIPQSHQTIQADADKCVFEVSINTLHYLALFDIAGIFEVLATSNPYCFISFSCYRNDCFVLMLTLCLQAEFKRILFVVIKIFIRLLCIIDTSR